MHADSGSLVEGKNVAQFRVGSQHFSAGWYLMKNVHTLFFSVITLQFWDEFVTKDVNFGLLSGGL